MVTKKIHLSSYEDVKTFVNIMNTYDYDAQLCDDSYVINPKSIVGVLGIDLNEILTLQIKGNTCPDLLEKLSPYMAE